MAPDPGDGSDGLSGPYHASSLRAWRHLNYAIARNLPSNVATARNLTRATLRKLHASPRVR